ncbi:hypothetical protein BGX29_011987 [Mortierella sp. GBA35]|nr:hypothetical protein BGX29_011987 [Mortierella sp. GBA35]
MESTMYNEMMHEVVMENDDLRKQMKEVQRKLLTSICNTNTNNSTTSNNSATAIKVSNSSSNSIGGRSCRPRRNPDYYGYPDDGSDSDDDMEEIII